MGKSNGTERVIRARVLLERFRDNEDKIRQAFELLAEFGQVSTLPGRRNTVVMTMAELPRILEREEYGALQTTVNTLKNMDSTFTVATSKKGFQTVPRTYSCELSEFVVMCRELGVEVPERISKEAPAPQHEPIQR